MSDETDHQPTSENTGGTGPHETDGTLNSEQSAALVAATRNTLANGIVKNHVISGMAMGLVPIPLFDLTALSANQMNMLTALSELYEVPFKELQLRPLLTSLVSGSIPVLGVVGLSSFAKLIPGIGTLAGSASVSVLAGAITYAVGQVFVMHFEEGGTLEDFDVKQAQAYFKQEIESGKSFVAELREELSAAKE